MTNMHEVARKADVYVEKFLASDKKGQTVKGFSEYSMKQALKRSGAHRVEARTVNGKVHLIKVPQF